MEQRTLTEAQRDQVWQWLCDCPSPGGRDLLRTLPYYLRRVIELRYGLADGHRYSLEETANVLDKSISWVVDVEAQAIYLLYQFVAPADALHDC